MSIIQKYYTNLKRYEKAGKWFESLSDEKIATVENTKAYKEFLNILSILNKLYPIVKDKYGFDYTCTKDIPQEVIKRWNLT